jgi:hypothetical protein
MDGKMGPARQFAPAIPNSHAESQDGQFYSLNDENDENLGNAERNVETGEEGSTPDLDSDGDDDDAIPEDDVDMQTLLGDRVISSQPQDAHFFVANDQAVEGIEGETVGLRLCQSRARRRRRITPCTVRTTNAMPTTTTLTSTVSVEAAIVTTAMPTTTTLTSTVSVEAAIVSTAMPIAIAAVLPTSTQKSLCLIFFNCRTYL